MYPSKQKEKQVQYDIQIIPSSPAIELFLDKFSKYETRFRIKDSILEDLLESLAEKSYDSLITESNLLKFYEEHDLDFESVRNAFDTKYFVSGDKHKVSTIDVYNSSRISLFQVLYTNETPIIKTKILIDLIGNFIDILVY